MRVLTLLVSYLCFVGLVVAWCLVVDWLRAIRWCFMLLLCMCYC